MYDMNIRNLLVIDIAALTFFRCLEMADSSDPSKPNTFRVYSCHELTHEDVITNQSHSRHSEDRKYMTALCV
jgi:hypothetical protein